MLLTVRTSGDRRSRPLSYVRETNYIQNVFAFQGQPGTRQYGQKARPFWPVINLPVQAIIPLTVHGVSLEKTETQLTIPCHTSAYLPISHHTTPQLMTPPHTSAYLLTPPQPSPSHVLPHLPTTPHLITSPHTSPPIPHLTSPPHYTTLTGPCFISEQLPIPTPSLGRTRQPECRDGPWEE